MSVLKEVRYLHKNIGNNTKVPKLSFPKFIIYFLTWFLTPFASVTRRRIKIKMPLCLSVPVQKSLVQ